ncbi:MAG: putative thioesterase [Gammaproteobacteria bacterium]|jgi:medium-chain acyl-[acyl-carrier-protein] hydrolase|nr:putative thioesterase [Gammaproteobacteria bacterium]
MNTDEWLVCRQPKPRAGVRLFCLPFAGGGASAFNAWWRAMPESVELRVAQLPGREARFKQTAVTDFRTAVGHLADAFEKHLDRPYAVFGYSMGALLGFEVVRELRHRGAPAPTQLVVAAKSAPQQPARTPALSHLPRQEFIEGVRRYFEPPQDGWSIAELVEIILPALRADLTMCDMYRYRSEEPLGCPIIALGGDRDLSVPVHDVAAWRDQTSGYFEMQTFPGGHFFINDHLAEVQGRVLSLLQPGLSLGDG